jgi:hypothetical protein
LIIIYILKDVTPFHFPIDVGINEVKALLLTVKVNNDSPKYPISLDNSPSKPIEYKLISVTLL